MGLPRRLRGAGTERFSLESGLMTLRPVLAPTCGRCGKRREGLVHHCLSNSNRKATVSLKLDWGKCGKCRRRYTGNPLLHVCKPKSDFKRRKKKAEAKRKKKENAASASA